MRYWQGLSTGFLPSGLVVFQGRLIHKIVIQWLDLILIFSAHLIRSAVKNSASNSKMLWSNNYLAVSDSKISVMHTREHA